MDSAKIPGDGISEQLGRGADVVPKQGRERLVRKLR